MKEGKVRKEKVLLIAVVVFLLKDGKIMLSKKVVSSSGEIKIGEDRWNGPGGGFEASDKSLSDCARREIQEETQKTKGKGGIIIRPENLRCQAVVFCHNLKSDGRKFKCKLYVFTANEFEGEAEDSAEMVDHTWFDDLPEGMIPTDYDWLPLLRNGRVFVARVFLRNSQSEKVKETQIRMVKEIAI